MGHFSPWDFTKNFRFEENLYNYSNDKSMGHFCHGTFLHRNMSTLNILYIIKSDSWDIVLHGTLLAVLDLKKSYSNYRSMGHFLK